MGKYIYLGSNPMRFVVLTALRKVSSWASIAVIPVALFACSYSNSFVENRGTVIDVNTKPNLSETLVRNASALKPSQEESYSLLIHRTDKRLELLDRQGVRLWSTVIGIGRGGLKEKKDMADLITPTGEMTVDLILYRKPEYNRIARDNVDTFSKNAEFRYFVTNQQGLAQLFNNMSSLDFDGNGSPDRAYGNGYIGLTSSTTITGPKMSKFQGTPYWFSIAIHGTPFLENIGQANSGGCVHIDSKSLQQLIENGWVKLGTKVKIVD